MLQKKLKKWLPTPEKIMQNKALKIFAPHLSDARLWHFNRRCLNKAVYIGVITAFFPLPGQMPIALALCLIFRANVPMATALTWITNPLTTIPIFYMAYWVGSLIFNVPMITFDIIGKILSDLSLWIFSEGDNPFNTYRDSISISAFLAGLVILGGVSSVVCGVLFNFAWQYKVIALWRKRHGYRLPNVKNKLKEKKK